MRPDAIPIASSSFRSQSTGWLPVRRHLAHPPAGLPDGRRNGSCGPFHADVFSIEYGKSAAAGSGFARAGGAHRHRQPGAS